MITVKGGLDQWWQIDLDPWADPPVFRWHFHHHNVKHMSLDDAIDYTACLIAQKFPKLYLLMSGGLDSEFVANCLYRNNITFTPVIGYIPQSHNQDYFHAMYWCEKYKVEPVCIEFELDDERLQKSHAYVCKNFGIINDVFFLKPLIDYVSAQGGVHLIGEPTLNSEFRHSKWHDPIGNYFDVTPQGLFGSIYTRGEHPAEFCAYTPELILAIAKSTNTDVNNAMAKTTLYKVPFRPKTNPFQMLYPETKQKIKKICKVEHLPMSLSYGWDKQEFLKLLAKQ